VLALGRFLGKDMAFESMLPFDFAGSCEGKPLFLHWIWFLLLAFYCI